MPGKTPSLLDVPSEVRFIVVYLQQHGYRAYVVGGALRDLLLERGRHDWDVATSASPADVVRLFPRVAPIGYRHGTVLVLESGQQVEVSTFRGETIDEDLLHRDFTINAMAFSIRRNRLIDPFGGMEDLGRSILRAVASPKDRFLEDPLRILRAVRIATELGFSIHFRTWAAMKQAAGDLQVCAPERIRQELNKMLLTPRADEAFDLLRECGALSLIIAEFFDDESRTGTMALEHAVHTVRNLPPSLTLRWAGLLHDIGRPLLRRRTPVESGGHIGHARVSARLAEEILARLRFSRKEIEQVVRLIRYHGLEPAGAWPPPAIRRLVGQVGPDVMGDLMELRRADLLASGGDPKRMAALESLRARVQECLAGRSWDQRPALTGHDIMKIMGIPPGPLVGKVKRKLQQRVTERPESNTREQLSRWLKEEYLPKTDLPHRIRKSE